MMKNIIIALGNRTGAIEGPYNFSKITPLSSALNSLTWEKNGLSVQDRFYTVATNTMRGAGGLVWIASMIFLGNTEHTNLIDMRPCRLLILHMLTHELKELA